LKSPCARAALRTAAATSPAPACCFIVDVRRFKIVVQGSKYLRPAPKYVTTSRKIAGLCTAAVLSLALVPSALAAPAGDEYLPKVPQSGAQSSAAGSSGTAAGTGTTGETGPKSPSGEKQESQDTEQGKKKSEVTPVISSDSDDSGGGSSGSILFSPIVLLMVAAVIAAAVGMTLLRRKGDEDDPGRPGAPGSEKPGARRESGPRTPDGEIVTGPDTTA